LVSILDFLTYLESKLEEKGLNQQQAIETLKVMPIKEFIDLGKDWIQNSPSSELTIVQ
jgi:hypothetical protein